MSYNIVLKKSVFKDLSRLSKTEAKRILDKMEKDLPSTAIKCPTLKGKFKWLRKLKLAATN